MRIAYSQVETGFREFIDKECVRNFEKLNRLLKRYAPDLAQLHISLEKSPHRVEYGVSLNLTLPTGTLHAVGLGGDVRASAKAAFVEIERQVKKHQEKLRKDFVWKRKRPRGQLKPNETPSTS